jgi:hypothetical protein
VPTRYRGPAVILTEKVENISSLALQNAIRRRAPEIYFPPKPSAESTEPGQRPTALGTYPEGIKALESGRTPVLCGVSYIPNINLEGMDKKSYVTSCWWWPETREVVAGAKAHAVTVAMGNLGQMTAKERILLEMQLTAAALDVLKSATAVIWPDADAMWQPDQFRSVLDRAKGNIPISLAVAVKLGKDTQYLNPDGSPKLFARTDGLNAFGLMEVEWRAYSGELQPLIRGVQGVAGYLIENGPAISDGAIMKPEAPGVMPNIVVRHEPSSTIPGARAYAVYPQRTN